MIYFDFSISNPWSSRWENFKCWNGNTPFEYKFWEFQITKTSNILCCKIHLTHRQDHAGLNIELGLFGWNIEFTIYDSRHWDNKKNSWST